MGVALQTLPLKDIIDKRGTAFKPTTFSIPYKVRYLVMLYGRNKPSEPF